MPQQQPHSVRSGIARGAQDADFRASPCSNSFAGVSYDNAATTVSRPSTATASHSAALPLATRVASVARRRAARPASQAGSATIYDRAEAFAQQRARRRCGAPRARLARKRSGCRATTSSVPPPIEPGGAEDGDQRVLHSRQLREAASPDRHCGEHAVEPVEHAAVAEEQVAESFSVGVALDQARTGRRRSSRRRSASPARTRRRARGRARRAATRRRSRRSRNSRARRTADPGLARADARRELGAALAPAAAGEVAPLSATQISSGYEQRPPRRVRHCRRTAISAAQAGTTDQDAGDELARDVLARRRGGVGTMAQPQRRERPPGRPRGRSRSTHRRAAAVPQQHEQRDLRRDDGAARADAAQANIARPFPRRERERGGSPRRPASAVGANRISATAGGASVKAVSVRCLSMRRPRAK